MPTRPLSMLLELYPDLESASALFTIDPDTDCPQEEFDLLQSHYAPELDATGPEDKNIDTPEEIELTEDDRRTGWSYEDEDDEEERITQRKLKEEDEKREEEENQEWRRNSRTREANEKKADERRASSSWRTSLGDDVDDPEPMEETFMFEGRWPNEDVTNTDIPTHLKVDRESMREWGEEKAYRKRRMNAFMALHESWKLREYNRLIEKHANVEHQINEGCQQLRIEMNEKFDMIQRKVDHVISTLGTALQQQVASLLTKAHEDLTIRINRARTEFSDIKAAPFEFPSPKDIGNPVDVEFAMKKSIYYDEQDHAEAAAAPRHATVGRYRYTKKCEICRKLFFANRSDAKYCSAACRVKACVDRKTQ